MNSFPSNSSRGGGMAYSLNSSRLVQPGNKHTSTLYSKYLGKLYLDRRNGEKPSKELLHRAIEIIQAQAPKKNKIPVTFATTPHYEVAANKAPCLIGTSKDGSTLLRVPIFAICTAGCLDKVFFYVTTMNRNTKQDTIRYWIHAFTYKSSSAASAVAAHVIDKCGSTRDAHRQAQLFALTPDSRRASDAMYGSPVGSLHASTPQSVLSAGSSSSASDASMYSASGSQLSILYEGRQTAPSSWSVSPAAAASAKNPRSQHGQAMTPQTHAHTPTTAWATPSKVTAMAPLTMLTPRDNAGFNLSRSGQNGMKWGTTQV